MLFRSCPKEVAVGWLWTSWRGNWQWNWWFQQKQEDQKQQAPQRLCRKVESSRFRIHQTDRKGKYRAIKVTGGRKESFVGSAQHQSVQHPWSSQNFNAQLSRSSYQRWGLAGGVDKKIVEITDTRELCNFISSNAANFNHVNVATALGKTLKAPRHLVPKEIMDILEESALKNMKTFEPHGIANSLYAMAKEKYIPQERLFSAIEQRAEAISGDFNWKAVAYLLWAYAEMGRKPGERLMGLLEGRAEAISGEFDLQDVSDTLCA